MTETNKPNKIHWKPSALLAPVPSVMVSCGTVEKANIITIGWCGVLSTRPPRVYISVRPERHSYNIIKESGEFVINLTPSKLVEVVDYCGTVTGKKVDKAKKTGLTLIESETVTAPTIENCPMSLECKVFDVVKSGSHDIFMADVTSVSLNEDLLDSTGKLHMERAGLLVYSHGEYFEIGKRLGKIGISMENKKKGKRAKV